MIALPASMVQTLSEELKWAPSLVQAVLNNRIADGHYASLSRLHGMETELDAFDFRSQLSGDAKSVRFAITLEDHGGHALVAHYRADGTGAIVVKNNQQTARTVRFERDLAVYDSSDGEIANKSNSTFYVGCFIDTPAYDQYRPNHCFRLGSTPSQVSFKFFLPYTPSYVVWYTPAGCSGLTCTVPISPGQTISGGGYWVINGTPTGPLGADAHYIYEPGGGFLSNP